MKLLCTVYVLKVRISQANLYLLENMANVMVNKEVLLIKAHPSQNKLQIANSFGQDSEKYMNHKSVDYQLRLQIIQQRADSDLYLSCPHMLERIRP